MLGGQAPSFGCENVVQLGGTAFGRAAPEAGPLGRLGEVGDALLLGDPASCYRRPDAPARALRLCLLQPVGSAKRALVLAARGVHVGFPVERFRLVHGLGDGFIVDHEAVDVSPGGPFLRRNKGPRKSIQVGLGGAQNPVQPDGGWRSHRKFGVRSFERHMSFPHRTDTVLIRRLDEATACSASDSTPAWAFRFARSTACRTPFSVSVAVLPLLVWDAHEHLPFPFFFNSCI